MKIVNKLVLWALLGSSFLYAGDNFIEYKELTKELKKEAKKNGEYATTKEVKDALKAKDWIVADVRTQLEWAAAHIQGSKRIGRQAPETALANFVLNDDDEFIRKNLIVICNSGSRASIEAQTFKKMGFKQVKIYDLYSWIDECNPVKTNYSVKKDKAGTGLKFGMFKAEHCSNKK